MSARIKPNPSNPRRPNRPGQPWPRRRPGRDFPPRPRPKPPAPLLPPRVSGSMYASPSVLRSLGGVLRAGGRAVPYLGAAMAAYELYKAFNGGGQPSKNSAPPGYWLHWREPMVPSWVVSMGYGSITWQGYVNGYTSPAPPKNYWNQWQPRNPGPVVIWTSPGVGEWVGASNGRAFAVGSWYRNAGHTLPSWSMVPGFWTNPAPFPSLETGPRPGIDPAMNPNVERAARNPASRQEPTTAEQTSVGSSSVPGYRVEIEVHPPTSAKPGAKPQLPVGPNPIKPVPTPRPNPAPRPPRAGEKEKKIQSKGGKIGVAIYKALDKMSESAEVVDAVFGALPDDVQKRWSKGRKDRPFVDNAGQYGIDGADWKIQAIWHNWHRLDAQEAIKNIIQNEAEDRLYGAAHAAKDRVTLRGRHRKRLF